MTTLFTDEYVTTFVAGQPVTGRIWRVSPHMPTDTGADQTYYIARNTGKTRDVIVYHIPYARQPVGLHRHKPALKLAPSEPIDGTRPGAVAPQGYVGETTDRGKGRSDRGRLRGLSAWAALGTREGEDCLNLTVYVPATGAGPFPVITMHHGGGSNYLSAKDDRQSPERLAIKGNVVVRIESRNGNLGHFYLPDMEGVSGADGTVNFSLTDDAAALQWVQDHIADLRGDPGNVTMMGGSAGGNRVQCIAANPAWSGLWHKKVASSASAGFEPRVTGESRYGMQSYQDWCGERLERVEFFAARMVDAADPTRSLADAIADVGISDAVRASLRLQDFLALDEGRTGVAVIGSGVAFDGYTGTRSLTICQDGKTVFHETNRAAALAGAFPGRPSIDVAAENEYSVIAGVTSAPFFQRQLQFLAGGATTREWSRSPVYNTEWDGTASLTSWGALNPARWGLPWTNIEPSRIIFGHGYAHAAYCAARAVEAAGGKAYLIHWGYLSPGNEQNAARGLPVISHAGHTADEPYWTGNPLWDLPAPEAGPAEALTLRDIYLSEAMMNALTSFAATGDMNAAVAMPDDFGLFTSEPRRVFTPFDPVAGNWNVIGNAGRGAVGSLSTVTNIPNFWRHAWDYYDDRIGA